VRRSWTPSIVGKEPDHTFYLVVDCFDDGPYYREVSFRSTSREEVINDLASGQYHEPIHVIAFNVPEGWARVVSADIAAELQRRADRAGNELSSSLAEFMRRHGRGERQLVLKFA
jgi:hypothetical protein